MKKIFFMLVLSLKLFSYEVLSFGNAIIDYIVFVDEDAIEGEKGGSFHISLEEFETLVGDTFIKMPGGSATNTIKSLALLGHDCALIGRIGNDADGVDYMDTLKERGVDPLFTIHETSTGRVVCLITPDGRRTMRAHLGDLSDFTAFPYDKAAFNGVKVFHIEGYQVRNLNLLKEMIHRAKKAGAIVTMDLGCFELVQCFKDIHQELIEHDLDILFCNEFEAYELTGYAEPIQACAELAKHCPLVVVTTGPDGGYIGTEDGIIHYPSIPAIQTDDTGAGDNFIAGFIHGYLNNYSLEQCAQEGAYLASKIVQVVGTDLLAGSEERQIGNDHQIGVDFVTQDVTNRIESCAGS